MNKKIIFYNTENNGRYEYEASSEEEYTRIKREIKKNIAILFMRDISSREEIHLCKLGDEEPIGVTNKLIRLNKALKPKYSKFSLDEYIEKHCDSRIEIAIIDNDINFKNFLGDLVLNKKIIFFNIENKGQYEYEPPTKKEYKEIKKEIEEDLSTFYLGDGSLDEEIHFCKLGDDKIVNTTHRLIRLNESIKFSHPDFSLDKYIEKYSDNSVEKTLINLNNTLKMRNDKGEKLLIMGINLIILGFLFSKIVALLK